MAFCSNAKERGCLDGVATFIVQCATLQDIYATCRSLDGFDAQLQRNSPVKFDARQNLNSGTLEPASAADDRQAREYAVCPGARSTPFAWPFTLSYRYSSRLERRDAVPRRSPASRFTANQLLIHGPYG